MGRILIALLCLTPLLVSGSDALYEDARSKVDEIVNNQAARGATIRLSEAEVNALVRGEIRKQRIDGVTDPKVVLGEDRGTWSGMVDFAKVPQLEDLRQNFLLRSVLKGTSPVSATVLLTSGDGMATVDVESVTIGEATFEGRTLGFLVEQVILADFENAKIGQPFALEHNVERIKLRPGGIDIKMKD